MRKTSLTAGVLLALALPAAAGDLPENVPMERGAYSNSWESLKQWECPEWFKDAKFGLWAHWGPQCQAESGDWFARFMYYSNSPYDERRGIHFNPREYGLKEFCRDWKAERWDPEAIMDKYAKVGCKYFMALGNHHDNFDLWDSPYQEWNSVNVGPRRDLVKGWAEAARRHGLKFGVSIHASHAWTWLEPSQKYDGNLTKADGAGQWWEGMDPQELYAQNHPHSAGWENPGTIHSQWEWGNGASLPGEAYKTKLQNRCRQMVNAYSPDIIYFDDTVLPFWGCDNQWGQDFLAHYYNHSANRAAGGKAEVVACGKILPDEQKEAMLWDVERGIPDRPQEKYWQTCTCIGEWHYSLPAYRQNRYKSAATVVCMLVDIVSKNGNLLLSVPLRADGTYDEKEAAVLDGIQAWMEVNSESIYGTRVWKCFGEGPLAEGTNGMNAQGFNEGQRYSSKDVRYVTKDGHVYATILAWPDAGKYTMRAFSPVSEYYSGKVTAVHLLGYGEVPFTQGARGLVIDVPATRPNEIAPVFRITLAADTRSDYEQLQAAAGDLESLCDDYRRNSSEVNSGKYSTAKVDALAAAVAQAKTVDSADEAAVRAARAALVAAYADLDRNGLNGGGLLSGSVRENMTASVLAEADNFSGTLGGRYGALDNWTVENYNIANSSEGNRQGLDSYGGTRGISLGVWNDRDANLDGDLANARIYRKVTLQPGTYYFGAAYNSLYGLSGDAWLFVSKELCATDDIPATSMACYQVNHGKEGNDLYGLYVKIEQEQEVYVGWQANLSAGPATQEFRAVKLGFFLLDSDNSPFADKLTAGGWTKVNGMEPGMDWSQHYFAMVDRSLGMPVVARPAAGDKNWQGTYAMCYADNANPNADETAVWTLDAFDGSDSGLAIGDSARKFIISSMADHSRHFRTEGWSKVVWQTYSDFAKDNNYAGDGNRAVAYVEPTWSEAEGWAFKNQASDAYIGPWESGAAVDGAEFSAAKAAGEAAHVDLYAIGRTDWMRQYEKLPETGGITHRNISYLITNRSFERYDENRKPIGWVVTGGGEVERGYLPGCDGTLYMNNWQSSGTLSDRSVSQTVSLLPEGKYRIAVYRMSGGDNAFLFANACEQPLGSNGEMGENVSLDFELGSPADVTLGIRLSGFTSNNLKFDNFRLEYLGPAGQTGTGVHATALPASGAARAYDLGGRPLGKPRQGVSIINGKKVHGK